MKRNEKKLLGILVLVTAIVIITIFVKKGNQKEETNIDEDILQQIGIDINDEAYEGKKIYMQDGDLIIENPDGSKTIESTKGEETDLKEVSEETKTQYQITDIKVNIDGNRTSITGKITNNTKSDHKVAIGAKFYSNDRVKGSANTVIENLKSKQTQNFEIVLMGNMTGYTYKVEVEYTN